MPPVISRCDTFVSCLSGCNSPWWCGEINKCCSQQKICCDLGVLQDGEIEKPPVTTVFVGSISDRAPDNMIRTLLQVRDCSLLIFFFFCVNYMYNQIFSFRLLSSQAPIIDWMNQSLDQGLLVILGRLIHLLCMSFSYEQDNNLECMYIQL